MATATLGAFPKPPEQRTIQLPTGASLTGAVDLPKGLDEQCKVAFNLMLQLGPFLASIQCLLQILQFVQDVLKFTQDVPDAIPNQPGDRRPTGEIRAVWPDKHVILLDLADDVLGARFRPDLKAERRRQLTAVITCS